MNTSQRGRRSIVSAVFDTLEDRRLLSGDHTDIISFGVVGDYIPVNESKTYHGCPRYIKDGVEFELTPSVDQAPEHGTIVINEDKSYTYTPDADYLGEDYFSILFASQEADYASVGTCDLTVVDAPVALDDSYLCKRGEPLIVGAEEGVLSNDVNFGGLDLTVSVVDEPENGQVILNPDGSFAYLPDHSSRFPVDHFTYTIDGTDSVAAVNIGRPFLFTLNSEPIPTIHFPDDYPGDFSTDEDGSFTLDGDQLGDDGTEELQIDEPGHGQIIENEDGTYTYLPDENYNGPDYLFYTLGEELMYKTFAVNPVNDAPVARNRSFARCPESDITVDPEECFQDIDGDLLTYSIAEQPEHGSAVLNDNGTPDDSSDDYVEYVPQEGYYGQDIFTLTADDGSQETDSLVTVQTKRAGLKANSKNPAKQDLVVLGTDDNDSIRLLVNKKGKVKVILNGESQGLFRATGSIMVKSLDGNDVVDASKLTRPVRIYGGDGNDTLLGSSVKCSRLFGGNGNDILEANHHDSTFMDGGKGKNVLKYYPPFDTDLG